MAEYKKVKRKKRFFKNKNTIPMKKEIEINTEPLNNSNSENNSSFRVITGKKQKIRNRNLILCGVALFTAALLFVFSFISPTGLKDSIKGYFSTLSVRSFFPVSTDGNEVYSLNIKNRYFFELSNTDLSVYSNNGKCLMSYTHGMSAPVITSSETRTLLYDQGGNTVNVFGIFKNELSFETQFSVYCADITRNGYFAVATKSQNYTSMVTVYDSDGNSVYELYFPENIVTALALSNDGKKLAVCGVKASNGMFVSELSVYKYDSAEPIFKKSYNDTFINSLNSDMKNYFTVVSENNCEIVNWNDFSISSYNTENLVSKLRCNSKFTVICDTRTSDSSQNKIIMFDKKGKEYKKFDFNGRIDDIEVKNSNLLILSGNNVYLLSKNGEILKTAECAFGTVKVVPVSNSRFIAVSDNNITETAFD